MDQNDLIKKFAAGNKKAFATVYENQYGAIFYLAKKLLDDTDLAADIVSDSFLKLWRLHENFDSIQSIKVFLQVTTRNACFNHLRDTKNREHIKKELMYLLSQETHDEIEELNEERRKAEFMRNVHNAVKALPKRAGLIFELAYLDGMKNREIADRLGINEQSVKNHKVRAIKLMQGLIKKDLLPTALLYISFKLLCSSAATLLPHAI